MRQKEDKKIEGLVGGGWLDAWKEGSGSSKKLKFTWDSFTNLYHENGFGFTCRFDRCYARGDSINISNFDLMGNVPVNGTEGDYLSDHFGLIVEITANPSAEKKVNAAANRKREGLVNDNVEFFQFEKDSMSKMNKPKSHLLHLEDASNKKSFAYHKKLQKNHHKQTSGVWSSDEDAIMGSEETAHRVNGKKAMPPKTDTTTSKVTTMKSHTSTNSDSSDSSKGASKKEQKMKAKAKAKKKRNRFDSSSSSDEGFEDMKRKLREKQGKSYKKRLLSHIPNSSSDEDF